jgi:hypothetical protein
MKPKSPFFLYALIMRFIKAVTVYYKKSNEQS